MENLNRFRAAMSMQHMDAYIIPTVDPHFSEYTAEHWKSRKWLSGFTGSAGTLVVTAKAAALWTDSRYFIQAAMQLEGSGIMLQKQGEEGVPTLEDWLIQQCSDGACVGLDGRLISHADFTLLQQSLPGFTFVTQEDLVGRVWSDRPGLPADPVWRMPVERAGMSVKQKRQAVSKAYDYKPCLLTALDEIAWFFNIRGNDVAYNPVCTAFAIIEERQAILFADEHKISQDIRKELEKEEVLIFPYDSLATYCQTHTGEELVFNAHKINQLTYETLLRTGLVLVPESASPGPVLLMKACKTEAEIKGFKSAMLQDGIAWTKLLYSLACRLNAHKVVTEMEVASAFAAYRKQSCSDYLEESFEPIVAYGEHGAIVHYEPTPETDVQIGCDSFLLMDTGAHYRYGTTDTTRTWHFGIPSPEEKRNYTLVLQGMIRLAMAKFPKGTRGAQLDMLARQPLMSEGMSFSHGTGHGVGHVLCVHEGPQSIRLQENPVNLSPGMIQSDEPAVYIPGKYGIRIENLILVQEAECTPWGQFYAFETLTLVPICVQAIEGSLLSHSEREFLTAYQKRVCEAISPALDREEAEWLRKNTMIE